MSQSAVHVKLWQHVSNILHQTSCIATDPSQPTQDIPPSDPHTATEPAGVVALNGMLYVVGGDDGSSNLASVEVYNPKSDSWSMLPSSMGIGRSYAGVAIIDKPMWSTARPASATQWHSGGSFTHWVLGNKWLPLWVANEGAFSDRQVINVLIRQGYLLPFPCDLWCWLVCCWMDCLPIEIWFVS